MSAKLWKTGVRTGGKVLLRLDNKVIAFAQSARFRDDYGLEPVQIIGQLQAIEYVPTHARHEITITMLVVRNTSLVAMGLEPGSAGSFGLLEPATDQVGSGVVPASPAREGTMEAGTGLGTWNNSINNPDIPAYGSMTWYRVLHQKVFDIEVVDMEFLEPTDAAPVDPNKVFTGNVLLKYLNCFFAGGEVSVESNRVLMHSATFYAQDKDGNYGLYSKSQ
jgi:hypothetical protein